MRFIIAGNIEKNINNMVGKKHTDGVLLHRAGTVQNKATRRRADGLRQAKRLAKQGLSVKLAVALIPTFHFLIAKLQRHLEGSQRIEALPRDDRLGGDLTGGHNSSLELLHESLPPVMVLRISASV